MTTSDDTKLPLDGEQIDRLKQNLEKVEELARRLSGLAAVREKPNAALSSPNPELFAEAAKTYWSEMMQDPAKLLEAQAGYWKETVQNFVEVSQEATKSEEGAAADAAPKDKRFAHPLWESNPFFNMVKKQYLTNAAALSDAVESVEMGDADKRRLTFFTRQMIDMMAPTNFLATNPEALEKAIETEGQSLIDGLENLVSDLEANDGELVVRLTDESAFEVGGNIATTPGEVVYRNRLIELIQYAPTTDEVKETPIVLFPPWINKFYILDLKQQNSLIKWVVDQGYTLFVVSWVNPDPSYAEVGLDDYIQDGFIAATNEVKAICGVKQVNAIGYCIAGTTLSLTLSYLKHQGDKSVKSATFFTALTDFSEKGEFTPFLQDDFIGAIEEEVAGKGILPSQIMARTFSYLRANDLVYGPAIRSYLMGQTPPAFDLLYWNGDGTNLPAKMAVEYLRGLCQHNEFAEGGMELMGDRLHIEDVDVPVCAITCETDHIAAWKDCYRGVQMMGSKNKTFIVSQSGHIAGIVNPPSKGKYGHYTNGDLSQDADTWFENAQFHKGSWWPRWEKWLSRRSGKSVPARNPGDSQHPVLEKAPGTYVLVKTSH